MDCIQRNSEIAHYRLWYVRVPSFAEDRTQREAEINTQQEVPADTRNYTITELQPFTNYVVELAAVNSASQVGPKATIDIKTLQGSKYRTFKAFCNDK